MSTSPVAIEPRAQRGSGSYSLVRLRVTLAFLAAYLVLVALAVYVAYQPVVEDEGTAALHPALLAALVGLVLPSLMAIVVRLILEPVARLDESRAELRESYDRARLDALRDALTGLGNHRAFQEELDRQVQESLRYGGPLALLLIDLDDLKRVNDDRGHAGGDAMLRAMGRLATGTIRRVDRAFRIGGDEFAILMPHVDGEAALAVAGRLLATALEGGTQLDGVPPFSFSAGISAFPAPSSDRHQLYRQADAALYWCKRHGRTGVEVFDPTRHGAADDLRSTPELAAAVAEVVASRALRPVYQPIFALETGQPIGFEGLVRPEPGSGFRNAESLFSAAEAARRTVELDMACLEVVAAGLGSVGADRYVSFNVSPRTLETEQFSLTELTDIFARHGIPTRQVVLELTERDAVEDLDRLRQSLASCRAAGMRLAADDVGAGNAGLRLLSQIHFDIVKIDLSLVQGGVLRDSSLAVLRSLLDLAARWRATVVAEGVETPEQLEAVGQLGIPAAQGYLLGRPMNLAAADAVDVQALIAPDRARPPVTEGARAYG